MARSTSRFHSPARGLRKFGSSVAVAQGPVPVPAGAQVSPLYVMPLTIVLALTANTGPAKLQVPSVVATAEVWRFRSVLLLLTLRPSAGSTKFAPKGDTPTA